GRPVPRGGGAAVRGAHHVARQARRRPAADGREGALQPLVRGRGCLARDATRRPGPLRHGFAVTTSTSLVLRGLRGHFVVCRLDADAAVPEECLRTLQAPGASFVSVTRTATELSIVCPVDM